MADELVKKKLELLGIQKAKADRLNELLNGAYKGLFEHLGPGGFNDVSRKTCKNLEAAITASKRPGYFAYYEQPDHLAAVVRSGEIERLREQLAQLQKQLDQVAAKIEALPSKRAGAAQATDTPSSTSVHNLQQWFATYGAPSKPAASDASAELYTSFTPDKKVYGGTAHYSAFRSQASTMKKGRLTR